jgi:hypothetical protein
LNQVCFDETEPSEETSVRMLKLSDFYEFENQACPRIIQTPSLH